MEQKKEKGLTLKEIREMNFEDFIKTVQYILDENERLRYELIKAKTFISTSYTDIDKLKYLYKKRLDAYFLDVDIWDYDPLFDDPSFQDEPLESDKFFKRIKSVKETIK